MENHHLLLSILLGILCSFIFMHSYAVTPQGNTPEGYWKVVDMTTGNPTSIVQIWKTPKQELVGKIIKVYAKTSNHTRCTACKGALYNQPILGLTVLSGLKSKQKQWDNGKLLNPANGKTYSCALRTVDRGKKLIVRNYVGLPYFGRAQTWERVDLMSGLREG